VDIADAGKPHQNPGTIRIPQSPLDVVFIVEFRIKG
jgi:hypothetical protein